MNLGAFMGGMEGRWARHRRGPAGGWATQDGLRQFILVRHPGPGVVDFPKPMPVLREGGKGGHAAQARECGGELGSTELWLLGYRLVPKGAEMGPWDGGGRSSREGGGAGVAGRRGARETRAI